jgi:hypothetical protein
MPLDTLRETAFLVGLIVLGLLGGAYPSHFLPVEVHLLQKGCSSPHLTLRILLQRQFMSTKRRKWGNVAVVVILASDTTSL